MAFLEVRKNVTAVSFLFTAHLLNLGLNEVAKLKLKNDKAK